MDKINKIKMVRDMVDRNRREKCQNIKNSKDAVSEMYYEGARMALAEVQSFIDVVETLDGT